MPTLRRLSYVAFGVACTHLVFGAIVRISGSGMGCGDHWPRCYGAFFPPLNRPDLIIEVSHRYLASILLLSLIALFAAAWRRRADEGVRGPGGVLRSAGLAVALGFSAALLGAMTVKLGNAPFATLAHWTVAMSLVATVVATVIRAGGLGGTNTLLHAVSRKTRSATMAGAAMALVAVVMGGLTAKYPGASVACQAFPLCGANPDVQRAAVHIQLTHRVIALLLVLHLLGLLMAQRKRRESPVMLRAVAIAFSLGVLQLLVAGAMIGMHLPPVLRSLHEATGVSIWIATFALAYLARRASPGHRVAAPAGGGPIDEGIAHAPAQVTSLFASGVAPHQAQRHGQHADRVRVIDVDTHVAEVAHRVTLDVLTAGHAAELADVQATIASVVGAKRIAAERAAATSIAAEIAARELADVKTVLAEIACAERGIQHVPVVLSPLAPILEHRSTMSYSVAVIVARGADC